LRARYLIAWAYDAVRRRRLRKTFGPCPFWAEDWRERRIPCSRPVIGDFWGLAGFLNVCRVSRRRDGPYLPSIRGARGSGAAVGPALVSFVCCPGFHDRFTALIFPGGAFFFLGSLPSVAPPRPSIGTPVGTPPGWGKKKKKKKKKKGGGKTLLVSGALRVLRSRPRTLRLARCLVGQPAIRTAQEVRTLSTVRH